jgi:hypothetical protein
MRDLPSNGGALQFVNSFNLSASKPITLNAAGATINTQGFTTTIAQGMTGAGALSSAEPSVTSPAPSSEPMVWSKPARLSVAPL